MTVKEFYKWIKKNGAENAELKLVYDIFSNESDPVKKEEVYISKDKTIVEL